MQTLRQVIGDFKQSGRAIGHFNISDSNQLHAIALASKETGLPVIVGLSEGEREYFPIAHAKALIDVYRTHGAAVYLNADHTYSLEKAIKAIDDGVDSIVVDGANLPMAANIALVKAVVSYAKSKKSFFGGRDIVVEGELGYIGTSSKQLDSIPEGVTLEQLTSIVDAKQFVSESGVACFAPAVGNIHGMLKNAAEPRLHPERVKEIADMVGIPLVLHGASGNTAEDIKECISAGVAVVHINTEFRVAYRDALRDQMAQNADETAPYKLLIPVVTKLKDFIAAKQKLFAKA